MKFDFKKIPLYFIVSFVLAIILFLVVVGLSFWIVVFLLFWAAFYLIFIAQVLKLSFIKYEWIWIFFGMLLLLSIGLIFLTKDSTKKVSNSTNKPLTAEECAPIAEKYDGKVINVSADGLVGRIAIRITDKSTCKAEIGNHYLFTADLERGDTYGYMGYTSEKDGSQDRKYWGGNGEVAGVHINGDSLPTDMFQVGSKGYFDDSGNIYEATNKFFIGYTEEPYLSEERYQEIINENKIYIIDGREYIVETDEGNGMSSTSADEERAAREGPIVKIFDLKFSE